MYVTLDLTVILAYDNSWWQHVKKGEVHKNGISLQHERGISIVPPPLWKICNAYERSATFSKSTCFHGKKKLDLKIDKQATQANTPSTKSDNL